MDVGGRSEVVGDEEEELVGEVEDRHGGGVCGVCGVCGICGGVCGEGR